MNKLNKKGFTLIELLAVIGIISLVIGLSTYGIIKSYGSAKEKGIALNNDSILEAARIYSTESSDVPDSLKWRQFNGDEYFCTTIQRLKNAGLLKKEAKSSDYGEDAIITVKRDTNTSNITETKFLTGDDPDLRSFCDIRFFTLHYDYNVDNEKGKVPSDQKGEICTKNSCISLKISSDSPKRSGYIFMGWSTNADEDGTGYIYKPGSDDIGSPAEEGTIITLYAIWKPDIYEVKFDANGGTGEIKSITCYRDTECELPSNKFTKEGYEFYYWSKKNGKTHYNNKAKVTNLTTGKNVTLYANWDSKYKVTIKYNVGSTNATIKSSTKYNGTNYYWKKDSDGIVERKKGTIGTYNSDFKKIKYGEKTNLTNYNGSYMKITNPQFGASTSTAWKCISGECYDKVYELNTYYSSDDFCNAKSKNCEVTLAVNWEQILSPIITASDGIKSGKWHNKPYTLSITSDNEGNPTYQYKEGTSTYQTYENPISPREGEVTYKAKTLKNSSYSGEVTYESKLDTTPPDAPEIDNPSEEKWTNQDFSLTLHSTDSGSGIAYYQYKYADISWVTYKNSATETFETTPFSLERNEKVYVRACDYAGNCSDESETYIRIDKTKPTVSFEMLNGNAVVTQSGNYNSVNNGLSWINFTPTLKWTAADSDSGINKNIKFYYNDSKQATVGTTINESNATLDSSNTYTRDIAEDGYRYAYVEISDNAGNTTTNKVYFKFDKTAPDTPTISSDYIDKWYNKANFDKKDKYILDLSTTESLSGVEYWQYTYNENATATGSNHDNYWVTYLDKYGSILRGNTIKSPEFTANRNQPVYIRTCDYAGNCSEKASTQIKIDTVAPGKPTINNPYKDRWYNIASSNEASNNENKKYKLGLSTSDNLSKVAKWQYTYNENATATGSNHDNYWVTYLDKYGSILRENTIKSPEFTANRNQPVYIRACDYAGNCSEKASTQIKIDTVAPIKPSIYNPSGGNWTSDGFNLKLESSDKTSGLNYYQYKYNNTDWIAYNNSAYETFYTTPFTQERNELAYLRACDKAGNCSKENSTYIRIGTKHTKYTNASLLKCRSGPGTDYTTITHYGCGTSLTLIKPEGSNWYYSSNGSCYVNGDYLQSDKPNCGSSSGSGGDSSGGGGDSSGGGTNQNYYVILHKNCPANLNCNFTQNRSDPYTFSYTNEASITSFPDLVVSSSPNNFKVIGWLVDSPNSNKIIKKLINYEENGKNLYAYWMSTNSICSCGNDYDCDGNSCQNGICWKKDGNSWISTCWG